jgi:hypothetical protein
MRTHLLRNCAGLFAASCALLAVSGTGGAQPFPGGKAPAVPLVVALLPYVGDETVQKELKLDAQQVKKLVAHRQKQWDEAWETAPKDADLAARYKATEAEFKATLSADQLKRANQIATQIAWSNTRGGLGGGGPAFPGAALPTPDPRRVPAYVLAQYPAIAESLKLDATQKKLAAEAPGRGRFDSTVYLSPDQAATAKGLLGEPLKAAPRASFDPRNVGGPFGGFRGNYPPVLRYTAAPDVQKELGLKEEQLRALADLREKANRPVNFAELQGTSPTARKKAADEFRKEVDAALAKALTADQLKRLRQIERQVQSGPDPVFLGPGDLAKELGVSDDQREKFAKAQADHGEAIAKLLLSGEPFEKLKTAFDAAVKNHDETVAAILTPEQQARRNELVGEPFTGNAFAGGVQQGVAAAQRRLSFGRYSNQLATLVRFKGVQEELQLKEEQLKKLTELNGELQKQFPPPAMFQALQQGGKEAEKFFADRSGFIDKALADVLTKEQQARFRELNLQRLEAPPRTPGSEFGPFGRNTATSYPGVAEAIKLTEEQKKNLLDGTDPLRVLTDEQKKAIKSMLGKPAKIEVVFAVPDSPQVPDAGALSAAHQLTLDTLVWDALKLDREQSANVAAAANEYVLVTGRRGGFGGFPDGGQPGGQKEQAAAAEEYRKALDATLTADQKKRLGQLAIQQALANSLDTALSRPANAEPSKSLALTEDQRKKVTALAADVRQVAVLLDQTFIAWEKELAVRGKLRDQLDVQLLQVLTADQRAKLKELTGEPFAGFAKRPIFGGFGGFGGGFGGPFGGPFGP